MAEDYLRDRSEDEETYTSTEDYNDKQKSKGELAKQWADRINSSDRVYKGWADRFRVEMLYQYYEGFQWFFETDENNRPYVINMIYSTIETKLPNLLFDNPQFGVRARPLGVEFDEDTAMKTSQTKEDALNYVCNRKEFGLSDKHELATLDAMFGFGIIETDYSDDPVINPNIPMEGSKDPLDYMYCKQIPYDTFRAATLANWDLSTGKWYGYFEFIPWERLKKYKDKLNYPDKPWTDEDIVAAVDASSGKITVATDSNSVVAPAGTCKIWKFWDIDTGKFCMLAPDDAKTDGDRVLEYKDYDFTPHSFLRFGKRRKGWYPYPPVWNWISPQDELNDTRQAQRLHRKRFTRKYLIREGAFNDQNEIDKIMYGPDGTHAVASGELNNAILPVPDAPMDPVDNNSIMLTYDDFNRISGTPDEQRGIAPSSNRTTATQAGIMDRRSQIREAKDSLRVADFMCLIGKNILKALRKAKKSFWIEAKIPQIDGPMREMKKVQYKWRQIPPQALKDDDYDIDLTVTSVSPISAEQDKKAFLEFLAVITQYEILAFSPALIREAAYRVGYKNEAVLNQFMQMAQLAAIGKMTQMKQQVQGPPIGAPEGMQPGQLPQQQVDQSTPPDNQAIMNAIFNRGGVM